jgi:tetratricopeptide (TPR) repeat protein
MAALALALLLSIGSLASAQTVDEISRRQALDRYRAGQELLTAERYEQAAAEFSAAIQLDPLLTLAHYGLGQSYMGLRRYASAIQAFVACRDAYTKIATLQQTNVLEIERRKNDELQALREYLSMLRTGQYKGNYPAAEQRAEMRIEP